MAEIKTCLVKNRGAGIISYRIPEDNIKRTFMVGETKTIPYQELVKLSFQDGGREMMENYLQIQDATAVEGLELKTEPEYNMSEKDVIELLQTGSLDEFLDVLDFAPSAVIDLIKTFSVQLPLENTAKREALLNKTGFNVETAVKFSKEEEVPQEEAPVRRVQKTTTGRRTTSKYNVVEPKKD